MKSDATVYVLTSLETIKQLGKRIMELEQEARALQAKVEQLERESKVHKKDTSARFRLDEWKCLLDDRHREALRRLAECPPLPDSF